LYVAVVHVSGNFLSVALGCFQFTFGSSIHAQHKRIHDRWSRTELRETVSPAKVLVVMTLWIFLQPQDKGLTGHETFSLIRRCVPMITGVGWRITFGGKRCIGKRKEPEILNWNRLYLDYGIMMFLGFV
jgi:hypothetical protein